MLLYRNARARTALSGLLSLGTAMALALAVARTLPAQESKRAVLRVLPDGQQEFLAQAPLADLNLATLVLKADTTAINSGSTITRAQYDKLVLEWTKTGVADDEDRLRLTSNGELLAEAKVGAASVRLPKERLEHLHGRGQQEFRVERLRGGNVLATHILGTYIVDVHGPRLRHHSVTGSLETGMVLNLDFDSADLKSSTITANSIRILFPQKDETAIAQSTAPSHSQGRVQIFLGRPAAGTYRLQVLGAPSNSPASGIALLDVNDNPAGDGASQEFQFTAFPEKETGERIEFPRYLPFTRAPEMESQFNPGDHVETRVARLYYFRDAHRVAQLINRTAKSYNRAAVQQAQIRAQDARVKADDSTGERKQREREAIAAAQDIRSQERELGEAQQAYGRIRQLLAEKAFYESPMSNVDPNQKAQRVEQIKAELASLGVTADNPDLTNIESQITGLQSKIDGLRSNARIAHDTLQKSIFEEDRSRAEQFRQEVAAANEDPDTYAPAQKDSVDSVAQVSVSVIGEGVLQLRGPIAGINKIRTMIDQIDSPLGQVKVEVVTVQLNGEKAARMERPLGQIEGDIDLARFLTTESLMLLRKAIQAESARIAEEAGVASGDGRYQVDRDRKYMYAFFGRDFVDELYEMDSEFLNSENKVLGLHSMDTLSLNQALFVLSLARNDVRQRVLAQFLESVSTQLPQAEWDFRRSSELFPYKTRRFLPRHDMCRIDCMTLDAVNRNAAQRYHFRNFRALFDHEPGVSGEALNPLQREFIRLAQIFKSRMISEVELKQRVIERALIEDKLREGSIREEDDLRTNLRAKVLAQANEVQSAQFEASSQLSGSVRQLNLALGKYQDLKTALAGSINEFDRYLATLSTVKNQELSNDGKTAYLKRHTEELAERLEWVIDLAKRTAPRTSDAVKATSGLQANLLDLRDLATQIEGKELTAKWSDIFSSSVSKLAIVQRKHVETVLQESDKVYPELVVRFREFARTSESFARGADGKSSNADEVMQKYRKLREIIAVLPQNALWYPALDAAMTNAEKSIIAVDVARSQYATAKHFLERTRTPLDNKKLLDFLIDEREDKYIELLEGTRAHIATIDNYLKRLAIALEDDFKIQFYDPAFVRIRSAAREWDVSLSQIERTNILTNNRAFAKVSPQATMEFDLPKRRIAVAEAMSGAKALAQDYGALLQDPTFLAAYQLQGGALPGGKVQNVLPGLPSSTDEHIMGLTQGASRPPASALESLVPDPAIYQFETGTGFEIRPVIQPDGHSIIYDFDYLYTTNIREPIADDEKHLGRVKRHFVHTQVQTSSFEMREISRYQVALKVARTGQGVPMLQNIPGVGVMFRPLPSAESSLQQNLILGRSVVYPTLFDLMGLRWAQAVVDLNHTSVRDTEHVVRGRNRAIEDAVFDTASRQVDEMLDIPFAHQAQHRPDLYHRQRQASPYHPGGFTYPPKVEDPSGRRFEHPDRRPVEQRDPPYEPRFRAPIRLENPEEKTYEEVDVSKADRKDRDVKETPRTAASGASTGGAKPREPAKTARPMMLPKLLRR